MKELFKAYFKNEKDIKDITECFILEEDIVPIAEFTRIFNCAISFREAKKPVLELIRKGAGTKPHSIMFDKTFKEDVESKEYKYLQDIKCENIIKNLVGYVTYYREAKNKDKIFGIYLTKKGKKELERYNLKELTSGRTILVVDSNTNKDNLVSLLENNSSYFITGDYDTHDIVSFTGNPHTIPSYLDFKEILNPLNYILGCDVVIEENTKERASSTINAVKEFLKNNTAYNKIEIRKEGDEYRPIQHGAQVNYLAQIIDKEKDAIIIRNIANMSNSVAICSKGEWSYLENESKIKEWYNNNKIRIKNTWLDKGDMDEFLKRVSHRDENKVKTLGETITMFDLAQIYDPYEEIKI